MVKWYPLDDRRRLARRNREGQISLFKRLLKPIVFNGEMVPLEW
jgi:hypothetical protein